MAAAEDRRLKLSIIGDVGVGKTSFLDRYGEGTFVDNRSFMGRSEYFLKDIVLQGSNVKLELWDTAGQERFRKLDSRYYKRSDGIILAYDITSRSSFNNIETWKHQVEEYASENVVCLLIGCKSDCSEFGRAVLQTEGSAYAEANRMDFLETSAKLDLNVSTAIELLANNILNRQRCVVFTLMSRVVEGNQGGALLLRIVTLGGDEFKIQVEAKNATVGAALAQLREMCGEPYVRLVTQDGEELMQDDWLPGVPQRASCTAQ